MAGEDTYSRDGSKTKAFYEKYYDLAAKVCKERGGNIHPETMLAQMLMESNYGASANEKYGYSVFGVMADSWAAYDGPTVTYNSHDYVDDGKGGKVKTPNQRTAVAYESVEDAMNGYVDFLVMNSRYQDVFNPELSPKEQLKVITDAGWATSPTYYQGGSSIIDYADANGLTYKPQIEYGNLSEGIGYEKQDDGSYIGYHYDPEGIAADGGENGSVTGRPKDDYRQFRVNIPDESYGLQQLGDQVWMWHAEDDGQLKYKKLPDGSNPGVFQGDNRGFYPAFNWAEGGNPIVPFDAGYSGPSFVSSAMSAVLGAQGTDKHYNLESHNLFNEVAGIAMTQLTPEKYEEWLYTHTANYLVPAYKADMESTNQTIDKRIRDKVIEIGKAKNPDDKKRLQDELVDLKTLKTDFATESNEMLEMLDEATSAKKYDQGYGVVLGAFDWLEKNILPESWTQASMTDPNWKPVGTITQEKIQKLIDFKQRYAPYTHGAATLNGESLKTPEDNGTPPGVANEPWERSMYKYYKENNIPPSEWEPDIDWGPLLGTKREYKDVRAEEDLSPDQESNIALDLQTRGSKDENGFITLKVPEDPQEMRLEIDALNKQIAELEKPAEERPYAPDNARPVGLVDNLLDIGRGVLGLKGALTDIPEYERGAMWSTAAEEMTARRNMGLSPEEIAFAQNLAERGYGYDVKNIRRLAGGSAGVALGNLGRATGQLYDQYSELAARDEATRRANRERFYAGAAQDEQINRQIFQDELTQAMMAKESGAGLLNDALSNIRDRQQYERAYGKDSQYYQYMKALTQDAEAKTEASEMRADMMKDEILSGKKQRRDDLERTYNQQINRIGEDGLSADTPVTQVESQVETVDPTQQEQTEPTTQPGGGIIGDAGGDTDAIYSTDAETIADATDTETVDPVETTDADRDVRVAEAIEETMSELSDDERAEYDRIRNSDDYKDMSDEEFHGIYTSEIGKTGLGPGPDTTVTQDQVDSDKAELTEDEHERYDRIRNSDQYKHMSDMDFHAMYTSAKGKIALEFGMDDKVNADGSGILKEENVEVNETQSNGQIKKKQGSSLIKNETGKPLHEMTDDELAEIGTTRTVTEDQMGNKSVVYSQKQEMTNDDLYKSELMKDPSPANIGSIRQTMISENADYQTATKAIREEYAPRIKEIEKEIDEILLQGEDAEPGALVEKRKMLQDLMEEQGSQEKTVFDEYSTWADTFIDKWLEEVPAK
jgi:hypothetical protein